MIPLSIEPPPDWFRQYVETPCNDHFVDLDGVSIHYQRWSTGVGPGLVFVHGNGAHAHWWDFIAPAFIDEFDVVAMDMSGAGDSDHRPRYTAVTFAEEILAVCDHAGFEHPIIVGHSFGGSMSRIAGYLHGEKLGGIVLVDSAISRARGIRQPPRPPRSGIRHYASVEEAMRRFRLRPPQPCENRYIVDYIARHSIRQTDQGYCYKLDQSLFSKMTEDPAYELPDGVTMLQQIACTTALIYGKQSRFFPPEQIAALRENFEQELIRAVDDAHHHVFLDQPERFIEALSGLLDIMRK